MNKENKTKNKEGYFSGETASVISAFVYVSMITLYSVGFTWAIYISMGLVLIGSMVILLLTALALAVPIYDEEKFKAIREKNTAIRLLNCAIVAVCITQIYYAGFPFVAGIATFTFTALTISALMVYLIKRDEK